VPGINLPANDAVLNGPCAWDSRVPNCTFGSVPKTIPLILAVEMDDRWWRATPALEIGDSVADSES
jgi:hypothetical protein